MTLYLKYRPKDFESLVGQEFIKNTLRQAIIKDKLVWAYLFCWPRWTGKTSTARMFAKSINCLDIHEGNPCGKCQICQWFLDDNLVDIIEIDAASYTWVDNIRDIIERASFTPTKCKYKVYIIDEVHMLSKWAFNALLKILEEPPAHLKFILATTESHKIPETILSRCQRYDFKSITSQDLKSRLLFIAKNEEVTIDEESLHFIIKQSNGWLRNAISLFEQLIYNSEIIFENVINNYWIPRTEVISNFYSKLFSKDSSVITDFENIISNYNLNLFFKELLFYTKDQLIIDLWNDQKVKSNIHILEILEDAYLKAKNSFDAKTTFLVWIIKCVKDIKMQEIIKETNKPLMKPPVIIPKIIPKIQEENYQNDTNSKLSPDDLFDVFWDDDIVQPQGIAPTKINNVGIGLVPTQEISIQNKPFDWEKFIKELKWLWSKWGLTMSLRWSSLVFDGQKLTIFTKTKISLKQIGTSDNISLMAQALNILWFLDINIEIK